MLGYTTLRSLFTAMSAMLTKDAVPNIVATDAWSQQRAGPNIQRPANDVTHTKVIPVTPKVIAEIVSEIMYKFDGFRSLGFLYKAKRTKTLPKIEVVVTKTQTKNSAKTRDVSRWKSSKASFSNLVSFSGISWTRAPVTEVFYRWGYCYRLFLLEMTVSSISQS